MAAIAVQYNEVETIFNLLGSDIQKEIRSLEPRQQLQFMDMYLNGLTGQLPQLQQLKIRKLETTIDKFNKLKEYYSALGGNKKKKITFEIGGRHFGFGG